LNKDKVCFICLEAKTTAMKTGVQMTFKVSFTGAYFFCVQSCIQRSCIYSLGAH